MTRKIKMGLLISASALALTMLAGYLVFYFADRAAGDGSVTLDFNVKNGWGSSIVTRELYNEKLIRSRTSFRYLLRITGNSNNIKRGIYTLNNGMTPLEIIDLLTSGKTKTVSFTIPEGLHNRQIAEALANRGLFSSQDEFLHMAADNKLLQKYKIQGRTVEGYLFPETYVIPVGFPKEKIFEVMIEEFFSQLKKIENYPSDPQKLHELVTLASLVEREARKEEERPVIAGVLQNRLDDNQLLQVDASIQYLFPRQRKKVYYKDLEIDSPYNTYKNKGLPPGPISNPGLSSLRAALKPEKHDFYFYVAKPDGSHYFAKNYREHLKAKKEYIGSSD
ncbi:MAG: endolytic transglycosylase MltG [Leptospiraceae bacterium]|nr:endolytic transglycosylase MltG [Leptospiraceae bacterium]